MCQSGGPILTLEDFKTKFTGPCVALSRLSTFAMLFQVGHFRSKYLQECPRFSLFFLFKDSFLI
jgi:hypothetical protein